ncbi:TPA: hypothetical protein N0F65_012213 [Lagenidium giganteum]|uniref:RING-type E3 ubiquitin transferase n=1 Tax=Lagenidium giganteum TaxID=4803 RepID=A0AAV2ZFL6_9STRA|nr:TPA: hypothetical protein N0F65_012213 [Lagenidium giganteum]
MYYGDDDSDASDDSYDFGEVDQDLVDGHFHHRYHEPRHRHRQQPYRSTPPRSAKPPAPPTRPAAPCRFFVLGKCKFGSRCTFSHDLPETDSADKSDEEPEAKLIAAAARVDCPFFQRGNCKFGDYCRLRHNRQETASAPTSVERTCGVCFEDIVDAGKRFGLLSCDHCFCLDCLREWRKSKDQEVEIVRSCPACREPSDYIVPSLTFCTGTEKTRVVEAYKAHLSMRECKYFSGRVGSCPFGPNCFYAHRDAAGNDIKDQDVMARSAKRRNNRLSGQLEELMRTLGNLDMFYDALGDEDEYSDAESDDEYHHDFGMWE